MLNAPIRVVTAAVNPMATPAPKPTAGPGIRLSFELPAGDAIAEGQVLAR